VVRWNADHQLLFLGRRDTQVKVRGFRIELGEIEAVISRCPGVGQVQVLVVEDRLVGFFAAGAQVQVEAVRAQIQRQLPSYMVPARLVRLDRLPVTTNGKVDRRALTQLLDAEPEPAPEGRPLTDLEQRVARHWEAVLRTRVNRPDANFFELGGHSLNVMQLIGRLREEFGVTVELRQVFERQTLSDFAEWLRQLPGAGGVDALSEGDVDRMLRELLEQQATKH
jgi:acyl carrier protein